MNPEGISALQAWVMSMISVQFATAWPHLRANGLVATVKLTHPFGLSWQQGAQMGLMHLVFNM